MSGGELLRDDGCVRPGEEHGVPRPGERGGASLDMVFAWGFVLVATIIAAVIYFALYYGR